MALNKLYPTVISNTQPRELGPVGGGASPQNIISPGLAFLRKLEPSVSVWTLRGSNNKTHFIHSLDSGHINTAELFIESLKDRRACLLSAKGLQ